MGNLRVKDVMTRSPISVKADDPVVYAACLLSKNNFNGLPVISGDNILIGIITEYDLISQANALHLPTLIEILGDIALYKKRDGVIKNDLKNLLSLKVKDVMNADPLTIEEDAWIQEISDLFAHHHRVNPIPVVDRNHKLVGIVSRYDLIKLLADNKSDGDVDRFIREFEKRYYSKDSVRESSYFLPRLVWSLIIFGIALFFLIIGLYV